MSRPDPTALWRKAAVLGSLWAASEIVLGSFLHNARIPLTGHILTGIGIAILVAGHRLWPQRGLLWRAGLICAAMKSVSPSAVILAPMIAISCEGFLLEAGVLLGGANPAGYLLAGGLAMSWTFVHKLGGTLLFFGPQAWTLYVRGLDQTRAWLHLAPGRPWPPLLLLWSVHFLGGVLAAAIGMRGGGLEPVVPEGAGRLTPATGDAAARGASDPGGEHSLTALFLHAAAVMTAMSLGGRLNVGLFAAASAVYAGLCLRRYPRAVGVMRRSSIWSGLLLAALLAGLILGHWQAGVQMGLRALVLTLGFSCIGSELRNPVLRSWFERRGSRLFFAALEQAFASLPEVFTALPSARQLLRSPVASLHAAIARAPDLLEALTPGRVLVITGAPGEGKSNLAGALAKSLREAGLSLGGIHAPGFWDGGRRSGFDIIDLATGESRPLCRTQGPDDWQSQGPFRFSPDGLAFGLRALAEALRRDADVIFVDEVGPLELHGRGWADALDVLARRRRKAMVWVVRQGLVDEVRRRWSLAPDRAWDAGSGRTSDLAAGMLAELTADSGLKSASAP
jgi:nucleoside-triphosphatase THEP1